MNNYNYLKVLECEFAHKNAVISLGLASVVLCEETFAERVSSALNPFLEIQDLKEFYLYQKILNPNLN